jgi:hypothetical protein
MEYERLIGELCESVGTDASEVLATQHIMINDHLVALMRPDDEDPTNMPVIFELAQLFPDRDHELYAGMLATNAADAYANGYFCINPTSDRAAWRTEFDLREISNGEELASLLAGSLETAREIFEDVMVPA